MRGARCALRCSFAYHGLASEARSTGGDPFGLASEARSTGGDPFGLASEAALHGWRPLFFEDDNDERPHAYSISCMKPKSMCSCW
jgi:hypothetical protein